jgi:ferritin-like protein
MLHSESSRNLAASSESVDSIISIFATAEALAVTLLGAAIAGAQKYDAGKGLSPMIVRWVKAMQAQEQVHYEYLTKAGAKPLTLTFTVPQNLANITTDSKALLDFEVSAETIFIGAYVAAAGEFANLGQPALAQVACQLAGVESEHRVLANYGRGVVPPNNLAFEKAPFNTVGEAAAQIKSLGLLGTSSPAATLHYADFAPLVDRTGTTTAEPGFGEGLTEEDAARGMADAASMSESVRDITNIIATAEAMAVTLLGAAIQGAAGYTNADGSKGIAAPFVTVLKAAQSAEQAHYLYLTHAGAKPLTLTFNIPDPKIATDTVTLFKTLEALETAFIATYVAAAREFAAMKNTALVRVALQTGGVEAEHRALARLALGEAVPHNVAFEKAEFKDVGEAAAALKKLGFIGGTGTPLNYNDFAGSVDNVEWPS